MIEKKTYKRNLRKFFFPFKIEDVAICLLVCWMKLLTKLILMTIKLF